LSWIGWGKAVSPTRTAHVIVSPESVRRVASEGNQSRRPCRRATSICGDILSATFIQTMAEQPIRADGCAIDETPSLEEDSADAAAGIFRRPLISDVAQSDDDDIILDPGDAGSGPGGALGDLALVPRPDLAAQRHLATIGEDCDGGGIKIGIALERRHDPVLDVAGRRQLAQLDQIADADDAVDLAGEATTPKRLRRS
jgi:hypothetical protein